mmetsp:Transcript_122227/g.328334  ORF Transcript_122227/g.328334 Transcript_122227/m.328334 type:complete len:303 (-) Transcript_122227:377-1285(-)
MAVFRALSRPSSVDASVPGLLSRGPLPAEVSDGQQRRRLLAHVPRDGEADPGARPVVHAVVLLQEGDPEDEEQAIRRWQVQRHQRHAAAGAAAVHVLAGRQAQDPAADDKAEVWERVVIRAVRAHAQLPLEQVDRVGRPCQLGRARVHGHPAVLADPRGPVADSDILHGDLPVAGRTCDVDPKQLGGHVLLPHGTEHDLRALLVGVRHENGEDRPVQRMPLGEQAHQAEGRRLGHARQGQAQDAVEGERLERGGALVAGRYEPRLCARAAEAHPVPEAPALDATSAERDRDLVSGATTVAVA